MKKVLGFSIAVWALATVAQASPITFASVNYLPLSGSNVTYSWQNSGSGFLGFETGTNPTAASIPVEFTYSASSAPAGLQGGLAAHMTISAPATGFATSSGGFDYQITGGTIAITLDTPFNGKDLLLKADFSGVLSGNNGSSVANIDADSQISGQSVVFSSDFLTFGALPWESISFGLNSVDPTLAIDINQYLRAFTASGHGSFAAGLNDIRTTSAPEPSSLAITLLGGGLVLIGAIRTRIRR